jgi:hypothetical protein
MHLTLTQITSTIQDRVRNNLNAKSSATEELHGGTDKEVQRLMQRRDIWNRQKEESCKIRFIAQICGKEVIFNWHFP